MSQEKRYIIRLDSRTIVSVLSYQLYKPKWLNHFGSVEQVNEFIKNYNN